MNLRYITMSDPGEDLDIEETLDLLSVSPLAELGVQAYPFAMMYGLPRYVWFNKLLDAVENLKEQPKIALHVNFHWCDDMCNNVVPKQIQDWLDRKNKKTKKPLIKRIQLNIGDSAYVFRAHKVHDLIARFPDREFILPYNERVAPKIDLLHATKAKFSLLFDESYGAGIAAKSYDVPPYNDVNSGYAGGLSPENVKDCLGKIEQILPADYSTWIDAEGQLRGCFGGMALSRARAYLDNALKWCKENTK